MVNVDTCKTVSIYYRYINTKSSLPQPSLKPKLNETAYIVPTPWCDIARLPSQHLYCPIGLRLIHHSNKASHWAE